MLASRSLLPSALAILLLVSSAAAQVSGVSTRAKLRTVVPTSGPGLGNLNYSAGELFQPMSVLKSPLGHGRPAMVKGWLMVVYSPDGSGSGTEGGIEFWDVSDPRAPVLAKQYDNAKTHGLREAHGYAFSRVAGRNHVVLQSRLGLQFWDVTDPMQISFTGEIDLPGIDGGDYEGAWWVTWQPPYVYVAGRSQGLFIIDAADPAQPVLVNQVLTGALGGISPGMVYVVGNFMVLTEAQGNGVATLDLSDPVDPVLFEQTSVLNGYSHLFAAGLLLTSGGNGSPFQMSVSDVSHTGVITPIASIGSGLANGGYGSWQDGFFHSGFSTSVAKFDVDALTQVGTGTSGIAGRDEDFGEVLGNLVFAGDDHGKGSALIVHDTQRDTTGPEVDWVHPEDGASDLALTTRVGVSMSDLIDLDSVHGGTFRLSVAGGASVPARRSVSQGIVNLSPAQPLLPQTTYVVEVAGLRDSVGNAGGAFSSSFTTGDPMQTLPVVSIDPLTPAPTGSIAVFSASATGPGLLLYSWDFGDGSPPSAPSTDGSAVHVYAQPGRYTATAMATNVFGAGSAAGVQIVHLPLTPLPPSGSGPIAFDDGRVFVVNPDNGTVTALDATTLAVSWESPVGSQPRTLALSPTGVLVVVLQEDAIARFLDPATGTIVGGADFPYGSRPFGVAVSPDESAAYVTFQARGELWKLSSAGAVLGVTDLGGSPRGVAVTADSQKVLVTRFVSPSSHGEVWQVDAATMTVEATHTLAFDPGPDTENSGRGVPNYITSLRVSPDGTRVIIPSKKDNVARGLFVDGQLLTHESRTRTIVSELDLVAGVEDLSARIDLDDRNMAQAVAWSPLGDLFFAATQGTNTVEVFDAYARTFVASLPTGRAPQGLVFNGDGSRLFVHNAMSRTVSVFDTTALLAATSNAAPLLAEVPLVATEVLSPQVLLGKQLFHDAADPRLSLDGYISCAGCHLDGGSDGQVWDFTQSGEGLRNTIDLFGRAGTGHGNVHWTANFDEIHDFENDIRGAFGGTGLMTDDDFALTSVPLGLPKAGLSPELDALAAYVSSLSEFPKSPYRPNAGEMTLEALAGKDLFGQLGCSQCHPAPNYTDGLSHDVGTLQTSSGPMTTAIDTPTLRGVWASPPYLHDGQAATLSDVLNSATHGGTTGLTMEQRARLVAYLQQLE